MKAPLLFLFIVSILSAQAGHTSKEGSIRPSVKSGLQAKALISGVEADGTYSQLPPVLVELTDLPRGAAVWVEVQRLADPAVVAPRVTVDSEFYLRRGTSGVLNVGGLSQACRSEGTWTMTVLLSNAHGTTPLASQTFRVRSGPLSPIASSIPALRP